MKSELAKWVGLSLEQRRKKAVDLAKHLGVDKSYISQWLNGKTEYDPSENVLRKVASFFGTDENSILQSAIRPKSRTLSQTSIHVLMVQAREKQSNLDKLRAFLHETSKNDITSDQWKRILEILYE